MKKILKKNQIIITALVVMVAIAGYLSMTDREELTMNGHGITTKRQPKAQQTFQRRILFLMRTKKQQMQPVARQ